MSEKHADCTPDGLDMVLSLAYKLYDTQMGAFDAADTKAGGAVGYIAIAGSILSALMVKGDHGATGLSTGFIAGGFLAFTIAIIAALSVVRPRSMEGGAPPSPTTAVNYWFENGDDETTRQIIEGLEDGVEHLEKATHKKVQRLRFAYSFIGIGFVCIALSVMIRIMAS